MEIVVEKIIPVRKQDSKVKAFCSVRIGEIMINDIRLMESKNGMFIAFPSKTIQFRGQTSYVPYCEIVDKKLLKEVHHIVYTAYTEKI